MGKTGLRSRAFEVLYKGDTEEELFEAKMARKIYDLRTKAGLTQRQLATKAGTTKSVISRLEGAEYEGNLLPMLQRIAEALGRRMEIRIVAAKRRS